MTITQILNGPKEDRTSAAARAGTPLTEANVRHIIATMERETKSKTARKRMAQMAAKGVGNVSPEGRALYAAYAAAL